MAKVLINEENLTNIANAIREKNGETTTYKPGEMATAITDLPSGGDTSIEDGLLSGTLTEYSNNRVTVIRSALFKNSKIKTINMPNVTSIEGQAFFQAPLEQINCPKVLYIYAFAFQQCFYLTNVDFPEVKEIGEEAFYESGLLSANFPKALELDARAFKSAKITSINCPLVTSIGTDTFAFCRSLTDVNMPELTSYMGNRHFEKNTSLEHIELPKIDSIPSCCFINCTALKVADFGKITKIDSYAFQGATVFDTLIIRNTTMCSLYNVNALETTLIGSGTGYIYVPKTLIEDYKVATNWVTYAAQFRAIEDYPDICGEVNA